MSDYPHITIDPGRNEGRPCIGETSVRVTEIALAHGEGRTIAELVGHFRPNKLTLGEVYSALAYYNDHLGELEEIAEQDRVKAAETERERQAALLRKFMGR